MSRAAKSVPRSTVVWTAAEEADIPSRAMVRPKTPPYSWLSHPLAGMANTTRPVPTSSRRMPVNRSIGGPRQLAAEGGLEDFKPRHSLEPRGGTEESNPAPYCFGGRGQNGE
jgi:hypothetical protein